MIRLIYNNKAYKIEDSFKIDSSNTEVTFNDLNIDFTDGTLADLPYRYQEVKIREADSEENILTGSVIFTGFVDTYKPSTMHYVGESKTLQITLLSPLKMATIRTVTVKGTFKTSDLVTRVLQPLIDDGFTIQEMNIPDSQVTADYLMQTIDYCMNDLGYKKNITWFIDADKKIYVNSIDYLFGQDYKLKLDETFPRNDGLCGIDPSIEGIDYANVLNFKNVRLVGPSNIGHTASSNGTPTGYAPCQTGKVLKKGDSITFDNPIIYDIDYLKTFAKEQGKELEEFNGIFTLDLKLTLSDNTTQSITLGLNTVSGGLFVESSPSLTITFSDNSGNEGDVVFQRDNFFKNLITGFKWNKDTTITVTSIISDCMLRYTSMRFQYSAEIEKMKSIISNSGIVEKPIDLNNKWITLKQLTDYARSLMVQDSNTISSVVLSYTKNPNLKIGDLININMPNFYAVGDFAVSKTEFNYVNDDNCDWQITVKNSNLINSYIDLFRPKQAENGTDTVDTIIISDYVEEQIKETHKTALIVG